MDKVLTIKFLRDSSPRQKGEVVSFTGREGLRTANFYLTNGIAKEYCACEEKHEGEGCSECDELIKKGKREAMTSANFKSSKVEPNVTDIVIDKPVKEAEVVNVVAKAPVVKPEKKKGKK